VHVDVVWLHVNGLQGSSHLQADLPHDKQCGEVCLCEHIPLEQLSSVQGLLSSHVMLAYTQPTSGSQVTVTHLSVGAVQLILGLEHDPSLQISRVQALLSKQDTVVPFIQLPSSAQRLG
jgi:hypothetical protein